MAMSCGVGKDVVGICPPMKKLKMIDLGHHEIGTMSPNFYVACYEESTEESGLVLEVIKHNTAPQSKESCHEERRHGGRMGRTQRALQGAGWLALEQKYSWLNCGLMVGAPCCCARLQKFDSTVGHILFPF